MACYSDYCGQRKCLFLHWSTKHKPANNSQEVKKTSATTINNNKKQQCLPWWRAVGLLQSSIVLLLFGKGGRIFQTTFSQRWCLFLGRFCLRQWRDIFFVQFVGCCGCSGCSGHLTTLSASFHHRLPPATTFRFTHEVSCLSCKDMLKAHAVSFCVPGRQLGKMICNLMENVRNQLFDCFIHASKDTQIKYFCGHCGNMLL